MIKKIKTIFFLTLMLLSITGYAQVTDPNTKVQWLEGSWGARLYVRGGPQLDQYIANGYDYVAGAQEMVAKYPTMGHVLTNMTQNARTNKFTLRYNPNVHAVTGNPDFVISEEFVPNKDDNNEQVIIDVIKVFKDAGKKVLLYLNCKEFTAVDTSSDAYDEWYAYVNQYFGGDEYAARTNLMEGYMKRFKEMGVDGYWLDAAAMNVRNIQLVAMMRALDPNMIFSINTDKSVFKNPDGSNMTVLLDGCDDDDPDPYGVIKYAMNDVEGDFTGGHIFPLGQGGRGDSWAHEEFTIPDIQESNYQLFEGKNILKHMFMPMRQQWSVASATLRMTNEVAYRMTKKITMAGGAITFSGTTTDGTIIADEDAVLTYVNQKMEENEIDFTPYVRPACAFLAGEEVKTAQNITFSAFSNKQVGGADFNPGATASSGLAVSYISSNPAVATIVNNQIRIVGAGITRITARQNGNDNYRHAPFKHQMLTVTGGTGGGTNLALNGTATQSTTLSGGVASRAIDNDTNGNFGSGSVTASEGPNAWWEVDLGDSYSIDNINVFNRTNNCCLSRLSDFTVSVINGTGTTTYSETITSAPNPSVTIDAGGAVGQVVRVQSNNGLTLNLAEVQVFGELAVNNAFVPDPNKTYYIDCPQWNLRLAANGESEDAYTTSISTTGADVEWKFVDNGNGYWHTDLAAGGTKPRLRTDGTADADMNQTTANGTNTYYSFSEGLSNGTYFLTIPDGTVNYNRLQIDNTGAVKMTGTSSTGSWVSFTITEATSSCATFSRIQAENFNSMSGIADEGINIGFIENGDWAMYSNIDLTCANSIDVRASSNTSGGSIEVRLGSPTGTLIGTVSISNTGGWGTYTTSGSTINSVSGTHDVYLVFNGGSGYLFNVNWFEFDGTSSSKTSSEKVTLDLETSDADGIFYTFPNPVKDILNVKISGSKTAKLDVINFAGQSVLSYDIKEGNTVVDLSNLASGIYMLKVIDEQQHVQTKKIIKK
ncbi:carbohydrate-binding protein [uncultured Polaribacter sp.]|uniref:carbohydrate-binding protein n=1 Tax=uncultured Polaribacter sp. TaxID=174711 RepID=UPI00262FE457|nr:carbohydrate-binding protein [uncultured Polaribacter sp.]